MTSLREMRAGLPEREQDHATDDLPLPTLRYDYSRA
jgi:hypothetical protein